MRDKLIITISNNKQTKSYTITELSKKIGIYVLIGIVIILILSFLTIGYLSNRYDEFKTKYKEDISLLKKQKDKLLKLQKEYSLEIKKKKEAIEALNDKLSDIEEIVGIKVDEEYDTNFNISSKEKIFLLQNIPNGCPLKNCYVTAKFGYRFHPILKKKKFHQGIDLRAKVNTKVYATADGVIKYIDKKGKGNFGKVVIIAHNFGFETAYAHLNKILVKQGEVIKKGQLIALSGNSGRSTGPHLHYQVMWASRLLNPKKFIDLNIKNIDNIKNIRRVKWQSLIKMMKEQAKKIVQQ